MKKHLIFWWLPSDPQGDTCIDTYGSAVAPYGLVAALPSLQNWVDIVKEGAVLNCWKTSDIRPSKSPTEGSESWLVSFDECETLGREGIIEPLHDNKFFMTSVAGVFSVSVSYTPVIFSGKPIRVSITAALETWYTLVLKRNSIFILNHEVAVSNMYLK